uniref:Uncharacterized protein n=1 Tax=Arundo donax TaxID=35708 RepID=A0A0A9BVE5_ARUDO
MGTTFPGQGMWHSSTFLVDIRQPDTDDE